MNGKPKKAQAAKVLIAVNAEHDAVFAAQRIEAGTDVSGDVIEVPATLWAEYEDLQKHESAILRQFTKILQKS